jgi:REP element-mobilizing transposase RayT
MGSTYLSLHYHLVFSTKKREPLISGQWRARLHEYLGGTINRLGAQVETIGGTADHVHLLVELRATHTLSDLVRELKKASSVWGHEELGLESFAWQEGYATFTVSASGREKVRSYIQNQEEHHRHRGFLEELRILLQRSGVHFEERFLE